MKRFLTLALLATALSTPAFAESAGSSSSGSAGASSSSTLGGSVGANTGLSTGGSRGSGLSGTARVGADVGVGADRSASSNETANPSGRTANPVGTTASPSANISGGSSSNTPSGRAELNARANANDPNALGSSSTRFNSTTARTANPNSAVSGMNETGSNVSGMNSTGSARVNNRTDVQTSASGSINANQLNRNDIILIQQSLRQEGIYNGTADGVWGPRTANALMQFQEKNSIDSSAGIDSNTLNELGVKLNGSAAAGSKTTLGTSNSN